MHAKLSVGAGFVTLSAMPVQPDPDAALMLRVKRGDRAAFAELVDKYKQPLLNFIFRMLRDENEAEDVAQTGFSPSLQIPRPLRAHREILHLALHHRAQFVPERTAPTLAPSRRIHRGNARRARRPAAPAIRGQIPRRRAGKTPARRTRAKNRGGARRTCRRTSAPPSFSAGRTN